MSSYGITRKYGAPVGTGRVDLSKAGSFGISRQTFDSIENFIADNQHSAMKAQQGIDLLVRTMVYVIKGYAQMKSGGPVAPRHRSVPALAYRIPVQRITGAYFAGWTIRKLGHGHWQVYNDSKEAYLIEYGIHQRARRPILKMSLLGMLQFIQTTRTAERFLADILAPRRNAKGQFQSFQARLGTGFQLGLTAGDLPGRGASNPHVVGPSGALP